MEIKFKQRIQSFKVLVMFDLASKISGVCIFDLQQKVPIDTKVLKVNGQVELPTAELLSLIDNFFQELYMQGIDKKDIIVSKEAAPLQSGRFTTAQTLISLGKSHAILDTYCYVNNIAVYDYHGIAPATTHAYYKHLVGLDSKAKVTKEDIRSYLQKTYSGWDHLTLDESDAMFLCVTLLGKKWDQDIDEEIRNQKRHKKTLKAHCAIQAIDNEIQRLLLLKQ